MADTTDKFITRINVSGTEYIIKDPQAVTEAGGKLDSVDTVSSITIKDANGKYVTLSTSEDGTQVLLSEVHYTKPSITNAITLGGTAFTTSRTADVDSSAAGTNTLKDSAQTIAYIGYKSWTLGGTITVTNSTATPAATISTDYDGGVGGNITLTSASSTGETTTFNVSGDLIAYNGYTSTISIGSVTGAQANPSTGTYETSNSISVSYAVTGTSEVVYGWSATDITELVCTGGFSTGTAHSLTDQTSTTKAAFKSTNSIKKTSTTSEYLYIFVRGGSKDLASSFAINSDKSTVDSTQLGGGCVYVATSKTYTTKYDYAIYKSVNTFTSAAYVKLLGQ